MTEISVVAKQGEISFSIYGHSGYNTDGNDIVCAACSVLIETLDTILNTLCDENKCCLEQRQKAEAFRIYRVDYNEVNKVEVSTAIKTVLLGYLLISNTYPDHVKISIYGDI